MSTLATLPLDILLRVFAELSVRDLLQIGVTCKALYEATQDHHIWLLRAKDLWARIPTFQRCHPPLLSLSTEELKRQATHQDRLNSRWLRTVWGSEDLASFHPQSKGVELIAFLPGAEFFVVVYSDAEISLKRLAKRDGQFSTYDIAAVGPLNYRSFVVDSAYTLEQDLLIVVNPIPSTPEKLEIFRISALPPSIVMFRSVELPFALRSLRVVGNYLVCVDRDRHVRIASLRESSTTSPDFLDIILENAPIDNPQISLLSTSTLVVGTSSHICIYHIPDINATQACVTLSPVWTWRDLVYSTTSPPRFVYWDESHPNPLTLNIVSDLCMHVIKFSASDLLELTVYEHRTTLLRLPTARVPCLVTKHARGFWYNSSFTSTFRFPTLLIENPIQRGTIEFGAGAAIPDISLKDVDLDEVSGRLIMAASNETGDLWWISFVDTLSD